MVEKQKAKDGGQTYYATSRYVAGPNGAEGSLVLDRTEDGSAFVENLAAVGAKPKAGLSTAEVEAGIKALKPFSGLVKETKELANKIAEQTDRNAESVRVSLTEGKKMGGKFIKYWHGDGWCMPGQHHEGRTESLQSQLDSLRPDEIFQA
jgi:hypothetical protein